MSIWKPDYLTFLSGQGEHVTSNTDFGGRYADVCTGFVEGNLGDSFFYNSGSVFESGAKDVFDSSWFEDVYSQPLSKSLSSCQSTYSADTTPCTNDSTLLSFDHGDRASYEVQSMRRSSSANVAKPVIPVAAVPECTPPP